MVCIFAGDFPASWNSSNSTKSWWTSLCIKYSWKLVSMFSLWWSMFASFILLCCFSMEQLDISFSEDLSTRNFWKNTRRSQGMNSTKENWNLTSMIFSTLSCTSWTWTFRDMLVISIIYWLFTKQSVIMSSNSWWLSCGCIVSFWWLSWFCWIFWLDLFADWWTSIKGTPLR